MTSTRFSVISLAVVCVAFLSAVHQTSALSYEVCESYGAEWITDSPRLTGKYPYYSLLFFCNGDLMLQPAYNMTYERQPCHKLDCIYVFVV